MATIQQIQAAAVRFVDQEIAPAFSGAEKILVSGGAALLIRNVNNIIQQYANHPFVSAMGVLNPSTGEINVDALYESFAPKFGAEKIPVKVPYIGTMKIGKEEIDKLYKYIKEA